MNSLNIALMDYFTSIRYGEWIYMYMYISCTRAFEKNWPILIFYSLMLGVTVLGMGVHFNIIICALCSHAGYEQVYMLVYYVII